MFIYVAWYCNLYVLRRDKTMFVLIMLMQYHLGERNISFQCIKRYQMALLSCWDSAKFFAICFCIFNLYDNMIFHVTFVFAVSLEKLKCFLSPRARNVFLKILIQSQPCIISKHVFYLLQVCSRIKSDYV